MCVYSGCWWSVWGWRVGGGEWGREWQLRAPIVHSSAVGASPDGVRASFVIQVRKRVKVGGGAVRAADVQTRQGVGSVREWVEVCGGGVGAAAHGGRGTEREVADGGGRVEVKERGVGTAWGGPPTASVVYPSRWPVGGGGWWVVGGG